MEIGGQFGMCLHTVGWGMTVLILEDDRRAGGYCWIGVSGEMFASLRDRSTSKDDWVGAGFMLKDLQKWAGQRKISSLSLIQCNQLMWHFRGDLKMGIRVVVIWKAERWKERQRSSHPTLIYSTDDYSGKGSCRLKQNPWGLLLSQVN